MPDLADSMIAMEFLLTAKTGVRNYSIALTEIASPEMRLTVRNQLEDAIALHEKISTLMKKNGWLSPYNLSEQYKLDQRTAHITRDKHQLSPLYLAFIRWLVKVR